MLCWFCIVQNFWQATKASLLGEGGSPTLSPGTDAGRVCPKALHDAEPTKHTQPFTGERGLGIRQGCRDRTPKGFARTHTSGRTKSVQDAPTTNDHCCTEAKPSECPKGDRDCKRAPFYKNRLLLIVVNLTTTSFFGIFPD